jgi:hypothetical protein
MAPKDCPPLEDLAALAEGRLQGEARDRVVAHLVDCEECREVFAATLVTLEDLEKDAATGEGAPGAPPTAPSPSAPVPPAPVSLASRREGRRPGGRWWARSLAAAAVMVLVGAVVVYETGARKRPPSREAWLAEMPPAQQLVPSLWGGVVMRGGSEGGELTRQSAELGALLVDLEVTLAAGNGERAAELARRMATIMEEAGLLDEEVAALREGAGAGDSGAIEALRGALPGVEQSLRERFSTAHLDLGSFAEEARLAALAGDREFLRSARVRRYLSWLLSDSSQSLPPDVRHSLVLLQRDVPPTRQAEVALSLLNALAP